MEISPEVTFQTFTKDNLPVNSLTPEAGHCTHIFVINALHKDKLSVGSFGVGLVLERSA